MECVCKHFMKVTDSETEYEWVDDIPYESIYENYECQNCGMTVRLDVTSDYCENPY